MADETKFGARNERSRHRDGRRTPSDPIRVVDNLPVAISLSTKELDAIEMHLGPLLDVLLNAPEHTVCDVIDSAAKQSASD